jgi:hypothetical protein
MSGTSFPSPEGRGDQRGEDEKGEGIKGVRTYGETKSKLVPDDGGGYNRYPRFMRLRPEAA